MTKKQKAVVIGSILGDSFIQKTGKSNARLRLEHSLKQQDYLIWKYQILNNFFQKKPQLLERKNAKFGKSYQYIRAQSYSSPEFGKLHKLFYEPVNNRKIIPESINNLLNDPLSLAVWFMDDGYYYLRDKMAYFYLSKLDQPSLNNLMNALSLNFNLFPVFKIKKRGEYVLIFPVKETIKLVQAITPFVIPSMEYKIGVKALPFDPVSTEPRSKE